MKRKVFVVAVLLWAGSIIGGAVSERLGQALHTWTTPPGQLEVEKLTELYAAGLLDEVLRECEVAGRDARYAAYQPHILYIRWVTDRRLANNEEAERDGREFLERFPSHILASDLRFAAALRLLAAGDRASAERELISIEAAHARMSVAAKAQEVLAILRRERLGS